METTCLQTRDLLQAMERQFGTSRGKNLFGKPNPLYFSSETKHRVARLRAQNKPLRASQLEAAARYYAKALLRNICAVNQYAYFDASAIKAAEALCRQLFADLVNPALAPAQAETRHYARLCAFTGTTNPFLYTINSGGDPAAKTFVCRSYSPGFLLSLFGFDDTLPAGPVLDIGCGPQGLLVQALRQKGIEACGFDRAAVALPSSPVQQADWFLFDYGTEKWGTILANLSFCSHFLFARQNNPQLAEQFAATYGRVLASLRPGGRWLYTPALPFIEELLPPFAFTVKHTAVTDGFYRTEITKKERGFAPPGGTAL